MTARDEIIRFAEILASEFRGVGSNHEATAVENAAWRCRQEAEGEARERCLCPRSWTGDGPPPIIADCPVHEVAWSAKPAPSTAAKGEAGICGNDHSGTHYCILPKLHEGAHRFRSLKFAPDLGAAKGEARCVECGVVGLPHAETCKLSPPLACDDCGILYRDFGLDSTLPHDDWALIHDDAPSGILCANCMVKRVRAREPKAVAIRMTIDRAEPTPDAARTGLFGRTESAEFWKEHDAEKARLAADAAREAKAACTYRDWTYDRIWNLTYAEAINAIQDDPGVWGFIVEGIALLRRAAPPPAEPARSEASEHVEWLRQTATGVEYLRTLLKSWASRNAFAVKANAAADALEAAERKIATLEERDVIVREQLTAANARVARLEALQAIERELMHEDIVFYGSGDNGKPERVILCNDTFGYACADAEELSDDDLEAFHAFWKTHGAVGVTAWIAHKRGSDPLPSLNTAAYRRARAALAEADAEDGNG